MSLCRVCLAGIVVAVGLLATTSPKAYAVEFSVEAIPLDTARDLNDLGEVVGGNAAGTESFYWNTNTGLQTILPANIVGAVVGINNRSTVFGNLFREVALVEHKCDVFFPDFCLDEESTGSVSEGFRWTPGSPTPAAPTYADFQLEVAPYFSLANQDMLLGSRQSIGTSEPFNDGMFIVIRQFVDSTQEWSSGAPVSSPGANPELRTVGSASSGHLLWDASPGSPLLQNVLTGDVTDVGQLVTASASELDAPAIRATSLSEDGRVVGEYLNSGALQSFVWDAQNGLVSLPMGMEFINSGGWAWGRTPTIWQDGTSFDVNTMLASSGGEDYTVTGIQKVNNVGQILARANDGTSEVVVLLTPDTLKVWANPVDGVFGSGAKWQGGDAPVAGDLAVFDKAGVYTVDVSEDATVGIARVRRGDITFDFGAAENTLTATERVIIGGVPGEQAIVRVASAEHFDTPEIVVGGADGASGRLIVDGSAPAPLDLAAAFAPLNHPPASGPKIVVGENSQLAITGGTHVFPDITAVPGAGPIPIPYPNIGPLVKVAGPDTNVTIEGPLTLESRLPSSSGDEPGTLTGVASEMVFEEQARIKALGITKVDGAGGAMAVRVTDRSTFDATGASVIVGEQGAARIDVSEQSSMSAGTLELGVGPGSSGNVTVQSSTGASTLAADHIDVAMQGSGQLNVLEGGRVDAMSIDVAQPSPPALFAMAAGAFSADEEVAMGAGVLNVEGTGYVSANIIQVGPTGTLMGTGTIEASDGIFSRGKIAPGSSPGQLHLIGDLVHDGIIEIEIGGTAPSLIDVLDITGSAEISGVVQFVFTNGFSPQQNDQFDFILASEALDITGLTYKVQNLAPGFEFQVTPTASGLQVTALNDGVFVPEPGSFALLTLGAATLVGLGRRTGGHPTDRNPERRQISSNNHLQYNDLGLSREGNSGWLSPDPPVSSARQHGAG